MLALKQRERLRVDPDHPRAADERRQEEPQRPSPETPEEAAAQAAAKRADMPASVPGVAMLREITRQPQTRPSPPKRGPDGGDELEPLVERLEEARSAIRNIMARKRSGRAR